MRGLSLFDMGEDDAPPAAVKPRALSISELAAAVKGRLEGDFGRVAVQGELSGVKLHSSGHLYCDLKDEGAVLNAVAWRSTVARWKDVPPSGTLVVATGKLTTYPARSTYQLMIDKLEPAGLGALMKQLEELKQRLAAEGLFEEARKKDIPFLPRRIGLVTSPTGAVIQDMLHRIEDRCPRLVSLWPVAVQGQGAAAEIAAAVAGFNRMEGEARPDVIIVARGGGSFEDLMAFNSEEVARAIAASAIPVISGVGHEPDVTLCDLAADVRAPTPSAAAERAVPVRDELLMMLAQVQRRMQMDMHGMVATWRERLEAMRRLLPDPMRLVLQAGQRLQELEERVRFSGPAKVARAGEALASMARILQAHNPKAPLQRGFVYMVRDGGAVRSAKAAPGPVRVHFHDGEREAVLQ